MLFQRLPQGGSSDLLASERCAAEKDRETQRVFELYHIVIECFYIIADTTDISDFFLFN